MIAQGILAPCADLSRKCPTIVECIFRKISCSEYLPLESVGSRRKAVRMQAIFLVPRRNDFDVVENVALTLVRRTSADRRGQIWNRIVSWVRILLMRPAFKGVGLIYLRREFGS